MKMPAMPEEKPNGENKISERILPPVTAGISPENFSGAYTLNRKTVVLFLSFFIVLGFGLRTFNLGAESLSEDELNKLQTVNEYRTSGLSGRNGEHPFLMKGLQTASIIAAEKWNEFNARAAHLGERISEESALRFPTALFGTFTALLLFLLVSELFGSSIGLIAAALWAVDPNAVGFDRIAKEDSFLLFFFLLANLFWLKSQTRAERAEKNEFVYFWLATVSFGAMVASKYLPHLIAASAAYYNIFPAVPASKWRIGKIRWRKFFVVLGIAFIVFNPTILLPETWRQMLAFSSETRIGHDSYEFMGELYPNRMTLWLSGVPWTFYYVFIAVKTPLLTLIFCLLGSPLILLRKFGDGRFFIFFWFLMWFLPFTFLGGKFTRYFTVAEPLVLIFAAVGCFELSKLLADKLFSRLTNENLRRRFLWALPALMIVSSLCAALSAAPYFRLYTNGIGSGTSPAGFYFPHDEFYDTSAREIVAEIAARAGTGATIACETPYLFDYYAGKINRRDLIFVSLSDKQAVADLSSGSFIVAARGRRYFSNDAYLNYLNKNVSPVAVIDVAGVTSAQVFELDENSTARMHALAK